MYTHTYRSGTDQREKYYLKMFWRKGKDEQTG